jgi:hypothetical protein
MVTGKIRSRPVPISGLMPLMAAALLICVVILMQLMSTSRKAQWRVLNPLTEAGCTPGAMKTPAVYLEHIGDEDKPINSIVIAAKRPSERELGCGALRLWIPLRVFLVNDEELAEVSKLLKGTKHSGNGAADPREFRYVLVSKPGAVESGILDGTQSGEFFTALATYFNDRHPQPELHEYLAFMVFTFGEK